MTTPFNTHSQVVPLQGIISPRPVTVQVHGPRLLKLTPAERDAELDRRIEEEERQKMLAEANEGVPEPDASEWADYYPNLLQKAQCLLGYRPYNPSTGEIF